MIGRAGLLAALLACAGVLQFGGGEDVRAAQFGGGLAVHPQLGPSLDAYLIGSAPQGASGDRSEAWAYQYLEGSRPSAPIVGGLPLAFGDKQLVLLRYTDAAGWQFAHAPLDASGNPYRGGRPNSDSGSGRVTPRGGIVIGVDDQGPPGTNTAARRVILAADRGGAVRELPAPGPAVLDPSQPGEDPELLSLDVLAATDEGERTRAYVAVEGRDRQRAVATWSGGAWSRETICAADLNGALPAGCAAGETLMGSSATLRVVALAATGERGWMLVRPHGTTNRGITLFERRRDAGATRWVPRPLGRPVLEDAATPAQGVSEMAALPSPWALTATQAGVWIDGRFLLNGTPTDVTAYVDGPGTTTWCDATALCEHPLGLHFSDRHRSFAWSGAGAGTRVIAPLPSGPNTEAFAALEGTTFVRRETFNPRPRRGAAFGAPDEGWLGLSHVSRAGEPATRAIWPLPVRRPLTAIASAPGQAPGHIGAQALAAGLDGTVLRYTPGQGWDSEQLLGSSGVARDDLRGVAWPTPGFAFAVGDDGAMWRWDRATALWEPDPGAPFDFRGHLTAIAFQSGNPDRGYAVGRAGVLLRYDKSWLPEPLPPEVQAGGPLDGPADFTAVAFAGAQALVAASDRLLVNDGDGTGWRVDAGAQALLDAGNGAVYAVAGLPDGGAVAAGRNVVLLRDGPGGPWRVTDQPLPNQIVTAVGAIREDGQVRAVASISPLNTSWPSSEDVDLAPTDPGSPPPLPPPFSLPSDGTLQRQTATGWRDEERASLRSPTADQALKNDPTIAMLLDASGRGWLVGGWDGGGDFVNRASGQFGQTASIARYASAGPEPAPGLRPSSVQTPAGPLRLLVGGHAQCEALCEAQAPLQLMPDRTLAHAAGQAAAMAAQPGGPRALLYTGGRVPVDPADRPQPPAEANRLAALLGATGGALPAFAAAAPGDETGGASGAFQQAFAAAPAPFGAGAAASGTSPVALGAAPAPGRARTHYAVDLDQGRVRVVVIDNAAGSLGASDPLQNPSEPQLPWLEAVLVDARARGIPTVVMGNRSLNPLDGDRAASDAATVAALLRDRGASAYVFDSPERQLASSIPVGQPGIPAYGSGTLGYRVGADEQGIGVPALLMLEIDTGRRDGATNRAPIATRLIPVIEDLALEAVDGRVLNRSRPALFRGLGRRPRSGDRVLRASDPYVLLPNPSCAGAGCPGRLDPEVRFTSSDPDIANFVRQDPVSTNPRKPFLDRATDKPVPDASSGLLCAFNAGTTTVSVSSGGLTYSTRLTVRGGSVLRPCGTVPLSPRNLPTQRVDAPPAPAPPAGQPQPSQPASGVTGPTSIPNPPVQVGATQTPAAPPNFVPPASGPATIVATIVPPPGLSPRPIPPSGTSPVSSPTSVLQPAAKVEKQKEEELAPEQQQSAVRYVHGSGNAIPPGAVLALLLAAGALGGAGLRARTQRRTRGEELALSYAAPARRPPDLTDPRRTR